MSDLDVTARLKIHVERIVRPISANYRRKDEMREELLAHLTALYEEELSAESDEGIAEDKALARAVSRFGDPEKLRAELQRSVTPVERLVFLQIFSTDALRRSRALRPAIDFLAQYHFQRPGESAVRHAARLTFYLEAVLGAFFAVALTINAAVRMVRGGWEKWLYLGTFALAILLALGVASLLLVLIGHGIHRSLEDWFWGRRSWGSIAGFGALSGVAVLVAGGVFWLIARRNVQPSVGDLITLGAVALAMPFALLLLVRSGLAEFRRFGEWGSLELED